MLFRSRGLAWGLPGRATDGVGDVDRALEGIVRKGPGLAVAGGSGGDEAVTSSKIEPMFDLDQRPRSWPRPGSPFELFTRVGVHVGNRSLH